MNHNKIKPVVNYSDRCVVCGAWYTADSTKELKSAMRLHKVVHKRTIVKVKSETTGDLKYQLCAKCSKGFYSSKRGLCTKCFEISKRRG